MTIEEELKLIKLDYANLLKEFSILKKNSEKMHDFFEYNLKRLLPNLWSQHCCSECRGCGSVYNSPTTDYGQNDFGKCHNCLGKGYIWKERKNDRE